MPRLLIATTNQAKVREYRRLLGDLAIELVAPESPPKVDETGATFEENARIKALHYAQESGLPTLADDSGIEVDALGGRPGVKTRRYAGHSATDAQNNAKLLMELTDFYGADERTARYQAVLVLVEDGAVTDISRGTFEGRIAFEQRGNGGFGYDPLFEPDFEPAGGRTVGEMPQEEKNRISHRAKAALAMRDKLIERGY